MQEAVAKIIRVRCDLVGIIAQGNVVLAAVQARRPDAVILDISLPDISGMQVLPELRIVFPSIAIVMLTTSVEPIYRREALARGADEFVSKFQMSIDLLPAIERALAAVRASNIQPARRMEARRRDL